MNLFFNVIIRGIIATSLVVASIGFGSDTAPEIKINLCTTASQNNYFDLFDDLVELELLMLPSVETGECTTIWKRHRHYLLRQEISDITTEDDKKRIQIIATLYDPDNTPILSQVEFIERTTRNVMIERAKSLAARINQAITEKNVVVDPFFVHQTVPQKLVTPPKNAQPVDMPILQISRDAAHSFDLFLGFQRFSQGRYAEVFSRRKAVVVTKPFMFIGTRYATRILRPLILTTTLRGAFTPFELSRPIGSHESSGKKILNMVDLASDIAWQIVRQRFFEAKISIRLSAHYVSSNIDEHIPTAHLSTYLQLKEGINAELMTFLEIFDTSLAINGGYFPFVQNFSMMSAQPFVNFGWQFGISAESTLYRSFGLKLSLCHQAENFAYASDERVVSFNSVAYLGVTMRM